MSGDWALVLGDKTGADRSEDERNDLLRKINEVALARGYKITTHGPRVDVRRAFAAEQARVDREDRAAMLAEWRARRVVLEAAEG